MMQQVLKKGKILGAWKRQIVFVLQDVGMEYILRSGGGISEGNNPTNPIQFLPFKLSFQEARNAWHLAPSGKLYSATLSGIEKILSGPDSIPTVDEFKVRILQKGIKDGILRR